MSAYIYPVGALHDFKNGRLLRGIKGYLWHQVRAGNWRAVRNYFNGYLAEHDGHPHNCGRGWTRATAERRVERLCRDAR